MKMVKRKTKTLQDVKSVTPVSTSATTTPITDRGGRVNQSERSTNRQTGAIKITHPPQLVARLRVVPTGVYGCIQANSK